MAQPLHNKTNSMSSIPVSLPNSPIKVLRTKNSYPAQRTLLSCSNCDCSDNVTVWCNDCTQKQYDTMYTQTDKTVVNAAQQSSPLVLLCSECNIGLHKNSKMQIHRRAPFVPHINKSNDTEQYNLVCSNCECDELTVFCGECQQLQCKDCNIAMHQPKSKRLHLRHAFHYKHTTQDYTNESATDTHKLPVAQCSPNKRATAPPVSFLNVAVSTSSNNVQGIHSLKIHNTTSNNTIALPTIPTPTERIPSGKARELLQRAVAVTKPPSAAAGNKLLKAMNAARTQPLTVTTHTKLNGDVLQCIDAACTGDFSIETMQFKNTQNDWDTVGTVQITQISCGRQHCGAVTAAGSLFMWGSNLESQLGVTEDAVLDGDRESHTPLLIQLPNDERVAQLACGYDHNVALTHSGHVYVWGHGLMFKLGTANDNNVATPTLLNISQYGTPVDSNEQIVYVAAGEHNSGCIVRGRSDGAQLYIWGANNTAQCGTGDKEPKSTPTLIKITDQYGKQPEICSLAFGAQHTIAVTVDGDVYTWGNNTFGQLGYRELSNNNNNNNNNFSSDGIMPHTPSSTQQLDRNAVETSVTRQHKRGKSLSTRMESMSANDSNEIQLKPKLVQSLHDQGIKIIQAGCGEIHTNVLSSAGEVWSWGSGETHQIGIWDNVDQFTPVRCNKLGGDNPLLRATYISVGVSMCGAVTDTGDVYIWGYSAETPVPQLVQGIQSNCIQRIEVGDAANFICLTGIGNEVYEWKVNESSDMESSTVLTEPTLVRTLRGKRINDISIGKSHYAVVTQTGKLLTWGTSNEYLGIEVTKLNTDFDCNTPHDVQLSHVIKKVCCAPEHSIVMTQTGHVLTWGSGDMGRLGQNNCIDLTVPTVVEALDKVTIVDIAVGPQNTGVVTADGVCYVFGSNAGGQLGNGNIEPSFIPYKIPCIKSIKQIAFGNRHSAFCTVDGELYTIGDNAFAQLGSGSTTESRSLQPLHVKLLSQVKIVQVACGDNVTLCLTDQGTIYGFGAAETQQLGTSTDDISIPIQIKIPYEQDIYSTVKPTKVISISVSAINCAALCDNGTVYVWGWTFGVQPTIVSTLAKSHTQIRTIAMGQTSLILST